MDPVVHFEMPYEDKNRMAKFYQNTFGWQTQMMGPDMGHYVVVYTAETDDQHMIKEPGRINGGFFKKAPEHSGSTVVIAVQDIRESMKKIEANGGKVRGGGNPGEPDEIPGIGLYIAFEDTEGNRIALLQPNPRM